MRRPADIPRRPRARRLHALALALALVAFAAPPAAARPGSVSVTATLDHGELPAGALHAGWLRVTLLGTATVPDGARPPLNVAIAIDKSQSMAGAKLDHVKAAIRATLDRLAPDDILSVIAFDGTVEVLVPATRVRDADAILAGLDQLAIGSKTALFAGASKAAAEVRKFKDRHTLDRVVLIADSQPTVGPRSAADLARLGASLRREQIAVTTVGLGPAFDEDVLGALARASGGQHHVVEDSTRLAALFRDGFDGLAAIVATELTVRVTFPPHVRPIRVIGDAELRGQTVVAKLGQVYAGEDEQLFIAFEVTPGAPPSQTIAQVEVVFHDALRQAATTASAEAHVSVSAGPSAPAAVNRDLLAEVAEALGIDASQRAVDAVDRGELAAARELLSATAAAARAAAATLGSDRLARLARELDADLAQLTGPEWVKRRKAMRLRAQAPDHHRVNF